MLAPATEGGDVLLYVRNLFEYSTSVSGFRETVTNVIEMNYTSIFADSNTWREPIEHVATGSMGRALANGSWDLAGTRAAAPASPHWLRLPRLVREYVPPEPRPLLDIGVARAHTVPVPRRLRVRHGERLGRVPSHVRLLGMLRGWLEHVARARAPLVQQRVHRRLPQQRWEPNLPSMHRRRDEAASVDYLHGVRRRLLRHG